jgi:hypothetical protein
MNALKLKILNELMDHLGESQGGDLKSLLDESKKPKEMEIEGDPKGLKVESVEIMGKPEDEVAANEQKEKGDSLGSLIGYPGEPNPKHPLPKPLKPTAMNESGDEEMSDDELKELLKQYMG